MQHRGWILGGSVLGLALVGCTHRVQIDPAQMAALARLSAVQRESTPPRQTAARRAELARAQRMLAHQRFQAAAQLYNGILLRDPECDEAHRGLGIATELLEAMGTQPELSRLEAPTSEDERPAAARVAPERDDPTDEQVRMCGGQTDCYIRVLEGRRSLSAPQIALLIESYRARGRHEDARRTMELFLRRYPDHPRARMYRVLVMRPT